MTVNQLGTVGPASDSGAAGGNLPQDWNELVDPATGKVMGKWDSFAEAKKGYWEQANYDAGLKRENESLKELAKTLAERVNPAALMSRPDPADELKALGIPVDRLDEFVQNRIKPLVQAQFEPLTRTLQARSEIANRYPDYISHEAEVMKFTNTDPLVSERFNRLAQTHPAEALELAYLNWQSRSAAARASATGGSEKASAALPNNLSGGGGSAAKLPNLQDTEKALQDALSYKKATGDPRPFLDAWFAGQPLMWGEKPQ